jgi:hypothetical protein
MSDWLHSLPLAWMAVVVFGSNYLIAAAVYAVVGALAVGRRAFSFKAVSCCLPWGSSLAFSSDSPPPKCGAITYWPRQRLLTRPVH